MFKSRFSKLFGIILGMAVLFAAVGSADSYTSKDKERLKIVMEYAQNVMKYGGDIYHKETPSPLFANGINIHTREQLKWVVPKGDVVVVSDLASQQNLMRVLAALSNLTGDPQYKARAKANYQYYFQKYQDRGGLLQWGGHRFIDLQTLEIAPFRKDPYHELKNHYPFYDLMYEVNPEATTSFIKGFWNAHVYEWKTLETGRHGQYNAPLSYLWDSTFEQQPPFFPTKGLTFLNGGNDLIYAGMKLYQYTGNKGAFTWSKRLAEQYVRARHPQTRLGVYQFTQPLKREEAPNDDMTDSKYGDRAKRQFGPEFGAIALEGNLLLEGQATTIYSENALMQLELARNLGAEGKDFLEWTRAGMVAYYRYAYVAETNMLKPLFADGTDLSNFNLKRNGYYGKQGDVLREFPAGANFLISYARGFMLTGDPDLWKMARGIARANDLGDIGTTPGQNVKLNFKTRNDSAYALFSILDIYRQTRQAGYLKLARAIGDNIVANKFHKGFFLPGPEYLYANFDAIEPYALLALEAAIRGEFDKVPGFINGAGYIDCEYKFPDGSIRQIHDDDDIYTQKIAPGTK